MLGKLRAKANVALFDGRLAIRWTMWPRYGEPLSPVFEYSAIGPPKPPLSIPTTVESRREANVPLTRLVSHTFDVEHADALASVLLIEAAGATVSEALDRMPDRYNERLAGATTSPAHNCSWCASTTWRHCTEANRRSKHRARREHAPISSPEEGSSKSATSLRVGRRKSGLVEGSRRPTSKRGHLHYKGKGRPLGSAGPEALAMGGVPEA